MAEESPCWREALNRASVRTARHRHLDGVADALTQHRLTERGLDRDPALVDGGLGGLHEEVRLLGAVAEAYGDAVAEVDDTWIVGPVVEDLGPIEQGAEPAELLGRPEVTRKAGMSEHVVGERFGGQEQLHRDLLGRLRRDPPEAPRSSAGRAGCQAAVGCIGRRWRRGRRKVTAAVAPSRLTAGRPGPPQAGRSTRGDLPLGLRARRRAPSMGTRLGALLRRSGHPARGIRRNAEHEANGRTAKRQRTSY